MIRLKLNHKKTNNYAFFCPASRLHLTVSNPLGMVEGITPAIIRGILSKSIIDVDNVIDTSTGKLKTLDKNNENDKQSNSDSSNNDNVDNKSDNSENDITNNNKENTNSQEDKKSAASSSRRKSSKKANSDVDNTEENKSEE